MCAFISYESRKLVSFADFLPSDGPLSLAVKEERYFFIEFYIFMDDYFLSKRKDMVQNEERKLKKISLSL
jgi:hypothetical protein